MAGEVLPGKGINSMPPKQYACYPPGSASLPGVNMSTSSMPLTYDSIVGSSSVAAQAGSGLSSSLSTMSPQKMLHGYGPSAAQSVTTANRKSSIKNSGARPPHAALAESASYRAFEHSTTHQPLTFSVLAQHAPSQPQQKSKLQRHAHQQKPQQPSHFRDGSAKPTHPSASHPASSVLSLGTGGPSPSKYHLRHSKSKSKSGSLAPNFTSSTPNTNMASATASGMYTTHDLRRPNKPPLAKPSTHGAPSTSRPQIRNPLLTQSQPHITASQPNFPATYAMPEPIHQSFSAPLPLRQQQRPAYPPSQPDADYALSSTAYNGNSAASGQPPHAQSFTAGVCHPAQLSTHQQQWTSQPSSCTMPGPFSMPTLPLEPSASHQSIAYLSQPNLPINGSSSFVRPKKKVHFADQPIYCKVHH